MFDLFADGIGGVKGARPEILRIPGIFANGYSQSLPAKPDNLDAFRAFKIPVLVEHVIRRQKRFVDYSLNFAFGQKGGRVVEIPSFLFGIAVHEPNHDAHGSGMRRNLLEPPENWLRQSRAGQVDREADNP